MTAALPLPVSAVLRRATNARSAKDRHDTAYFAWEASVVLGVATQPPGDLAPLARPSLGTWVASLPTSEEPVADAPLLAALGLFTEVGAGRRSTPKKVSARQLLDALPGYRNQVIGHGSTRGQEFYDDASRILIDALTCAWEKHFFLREDERLTYVEAIEIDSGGRRRARLLDLMGDVGRVVDPRGTPDVPSDVLPHRAYARTGGRWRALHPWVLCQEAESRERVYLFASASRHAKYLDYVSGESMTGEALEAAFPGTDAEVAALFEGRLATAGLVETDRLGDYRILGKLGSGGMGTVYRARREGRDAGPLEGAVVALKIVHPHLLEAAGFLKRFEIEAEIGRRIVHENVVRTFDVGSVRGEGKDRHFLVMEYVEGQTLRTLLADVGKVPEQLCRHIGCEVSKGLSAIHAAGVVHRDMKPENVLITNDHVVKVMDLGLAISADERLRISGTGAFVGSVQYAAPEQFGSESDVDGRADLYALGVTLYELATGRNPYMDDDVHKTLKRVLYETPRRCSELNPQLSPFFEELVHALLAKKPEGRLASAAELARIFDEGEESSWWKARAKAIRAATKRPLRRIRIPRETAIYGREAEIAKLRALYGRARSGEGQVVLIEGEAGIGKSRLVDEFVGVLQREGEDLNFLFGSYPPGGAATGAGAFSTAYREQFGVEGLEETLKTYLDGTPALVPAFAGLLRGEGVPSGGEGFTKDSLQTVFVHSTRVLATERPTIVLIDDLQFAPEEGRALFVALAMAAPGHRIMLVGTARPGLDERWLAHFDRIGAARMSLTRLGPKDLSRLLVDALRSEHLAEELAFRIGAKSDGNPFFVFEILRGLREDQMLSQTPEGAWVTTRIIADIQIPSSILELVQARVADLDEAERNLLDVAACVGFEFDPLLVAEVLHLEKIPAMQALAKIEKRHRLVRSSGRRFVFDQHQMQEACYGGLPEILREEYHGAIAEALEARQAASKRDPRIADAGLVVDLARHFFKANRPDRALPYFDAALDHLDKGYQNGDAARLEDRALEAPGLVEGARRARLLLRHARRLDLLGRPAEEVKALEEARALADETDETTLRAKARNDIGDLFRRLSRLDEARRALEEALALYRSVADRLGEADATVNLGVLAGVQGRFPEARAFDEASLAIAREIGDRRKEATAAQNLAGVLWFMGGHDEARRHYTRALEISREIGDKSGEAVAAANLGLACEALGLAGDARTQYERALALSRAIGFRPGEAHAMACLGSLLRSLGRHEDARSHLERSMALSRETGDRASEVSVTVDLGLVLHDLGRGEEGYQHMERALAAAREIGLRWGEARALEAIGATLADDGKPVEASARLRSAVRLAREDSVPSIRYLATARLAGLPSDDPATAASDAVAAFAAVGECEGASGIGEAMQARFLLWRSTRDPKHLSEAKRRLDHLVAHAPADCRDSMIAGVATHREILAAAKEAGL